VEFGLLGLLDVVDRGRAVPIGRGKESALLAVLLLHANNPVSADRLVHELWGERAPENAAKNVQQYVSRLRRHLGAERLVTTPGGYLLEVEPEELDVTQFDQLAADGRSAFESGDAASAERLFSSALGLWRGPVLADFRYDEFAQDAIRRLEAERRRVRADRVDAQLALGRADRALPEVQELIDEDPHWERPRGQLMLALYRTGRQSDALDVYRTTRSVFDRDLGLEPSRELQELEREILNQDPALGTRPSTHRSLQRRHGPAVYLAAGGGLLGAVAVATLLVVLLESSSPALGNAVAVVDASGHNVSYTTAGTTPGNVVVGEGGVWVLNADDRTITHIDPATRRVVKTFATSGAPTDLAAGDGAIWVGSSEGGRGLIESNTSTAVVSRVEPVSTAATTSAHLPGAPSPRYYGQTFGVSGIAVGKRAIWAIDPDGSISRIDPATGSFVKRVAANSAIAVAAGDAGAWFLTTLHGMPAVARIDPETNTVGQTIPVETSDLVGIAVGAGSVWATNPYDGVIWRIHPGPTPTARTISLGFGVTQIAFGDGAVWAANIANGTVSRVDPRTDEITARVQLTGTPQALAVGAGSSWISVAGGTSTGSLPASDCGPVQSGGATPDVLVASDMPLQGPSVAQTLAAAVRFILRSHGFRAGRFTVGYQSCDDSTARSQSTDFFKCASNARDFGAARKLVAVIGPYDSACAQVEIPMMNRAPSGAVALVSPSNTYPAFTRAEPEAAGAPQIYYPTGSRNYFRLASPDDVQGAADAVLAAKLGLRRVAVLSDTEPYGNALARGFRPAARRLGLTVVAAGQWNPGAANDTALVAKVARAKAQGVFIAGYSFGAGGLIRALRARFGTHLTLIVGDGFLTIPDTIASVGPGAVGMYVSMSGVATESLTPAGRRLVSTFEHSLRGNRVPSGTYIPEMLEAAELTVDAIARSDGTRASVLRALRESKVSSGVFGGFRFDRNGDMTPAPFTIFRITGGRGASGLAPEFRGAVVDRTVRASVGLLDTGRIKKRK
jgi:DNA-binding SARP family transcriptional activator/ABC-type branched-subunit amino acid transport system substrate-binding protein